MADLFEKAARLKLRFASTKGNLLVEDLFDLPLTSATGKANLNDIARELHKQVKDSGEVDFVNEPAKTDERIQLAFDVVKHVIDTKKAEAEVEKTRRQKAETRQKLLEALEAQENKELQSKSTAELRAAIAALDS